MNLDFDRLGELAVIYGINFLGAVVIGLVGWWVANLVERFAHRGLMMARHMDLTVAAFLASLAKYAVLVVCFVLILQVVGIQATSLVAVLGAASLAIGLALQGTLSNMAAGVMLLMFRPFRIGDAIEVAGKSGTVRNLNLFMTELASGDNVQVLIPNGQVWGAALTNNSAYATRQATVTVPVALAKDPEAVAQDLRDVLEHQPGVLPSPAPSVSIGKVTDTVAEVSIQAWTKSEDAGAVRQALLRKAVALVGTKRAEMPSPAPAE